MRCTSHKTAFHGLLFVVCALWIPASVGCGSTPAGLSKKTSREASVREPAPTDARGIAGLDFGRDGTLLPPPDTLEPAPREGLPSPSTVWTIVLQTFSTGDHRAAARRMLSQLPSIDPLLTNARTHSTREASMVVFGSYEAPDSPAAQADLKRIKTISLNNRPVFGRAMLSRINLRAARGQLKQFELLTVRQRYPDVDPLYTLDIAIWGTTFESGELTLQQVQSEAEAYARQLRAQGIDAYFHHDADRGLSTVSVGLFDYRAIDPQGGLYHPDVRAFLRRFPTRLVNGEAARVAIDPQRPQLGTELQEPRLALVPKQ